MAVEILFKGLGEELDPEDLVEQYQQTLRKFDQIASQALSDKYLREGKEFLSKGDLVQAQPFKKALTENASLKLCGASATAVKSVAAKRGLKLEKHGALWHFVKLITKLKEVKYMVTTDNDIYLFGGLVESSPELVAQNPLPDRSLRSMNTILLSLTSFLDLSSPSINSLSFINLSLMATFSCL